MCLGGSFSLKHNKYIKYIYYYYKILLLGLDRTRFI